MKAVSLILLSICLLCAGCRTEVQNEPLNKKIGEYIRRICEKDKPCRIQIKDALDFSWDKLYVFDEAVEEDEIRKILQANYSSASPHYSRKWVFVKDGQIVSTEQHILYEIDVPVDIGNVLLTEDNPQEKFSVFSRDSIFEATGDDKSYYSLRCLNCP